MDESIIFEGCNFFLRICSLFFTKKNHSKDMKKLISIFLISAAIVMLCIAPGFAQSSTITKVFPRNFPSKVPTLTNNDTFLDNEATPSQETGTAIKILFPNQKKYFGLKSAQNTIAYVPTTSNNPNSDRNRIVKCSLNDKIYLIDVLGNSMDLSGGGSVKKVNNILPDSNGNVTLPIPPSQNVSNSNLTSNGSYTFDLLNYHWTLKAGTSSLVANGGQQPLGFSGNGGQRYMGLSTGGSYISEGNATHNTTINVLGSSILMETKPNGGNATTFNLYGSTGAANGGESSTGIRLKPLSQSSTDVSNRYLKSVNAFGDAEWSVFPSGFGKNISNSNLTADNSYEIDGNGYTFNFFNYDGFGIFSNELYISNNLTNITSASELIINSLSDNLKIQNGNDNTQKYLRILDATGKVEFVDLPQGGITALTNGKGTTANGTAVDLGGIVPDARNLDMGTAGTIVLKNIQNTLSPERDALVITNDANPISGGDGENIGIKFDVGNNVTRLAADDEATQLVGNKPIYITKKADTGLGGSTIVVGAGDMNFFTFGANGSTTNNLAISAQSISSGNYGSTRNDAGNPTSIASWDSFGNLERHLVSELGSSFTDFWKTTGNAGTNSTTNFVGTTDNQPLIFKTNNISNMQIAANGNVRIGVGANTAQAKLDVDGSFKCTSMRLADPSAGAGKYLQSNALGDATWTTIASVTVGDTKFGYQNADHSGWIRLDGRSIASLTTTQQAAAASLGMAGIIPNTANRFPKAANGVNGAFGGSPTGSTTLNSSNIPLIPLPNATVQVQAYTTAGGTTAIAQGGNSIGGTSVSNVYNVNYNNPNVGNSIPTAISVPVDPMHVLLNHFIYLGN